MEQLYLTIGQMAAMNHISAQTLRLYDRENIVKPAYCDKENGYRYYHVNQCAQLDMIHIMQVCGMTLKQIKEQITNGSTKELYMLLKKQDEILDEKIRQLYVSRKSIARVAKNLEQINSLPPMGEIFFENMPARRIDTVTTEIEYFASGYSGYERMLRKMKDKMIAHHLPLSYFYNAGTLIEKEDFCACRYVAHTAFIFVDEDYPSVDTIRNLSGGMVMAICADDPNKELYYAGKLRQEMKRLGYTAAGDYLCEVISRLPGSANTEENMIYKIQIPVCRDICKN